MRKLNLITAIFSLIVSIIFLILPFMFFIVLVTGLLGSDPANFSTLVNESMYEMNISLEDTGNMAINGVVFDVLPGVLSIIFIGFIYMILAGVMLILAIVLLVQDKVASKSGKILLIIAAGIAISSSVSLSFVSGILGIIASSLLLASNNKYHKVSKEQAVVE